MITRCNERDRLVKGQVSSVPINRKFHSFESSCILTATANKLSTCIRKKALNVFTVKSLNLVCLLLRSSRGCIKCVSIRLGSFGTFYCFVDARRGKKKWSKSKVRANLERLGSCCRVEFIETMQQRSSRHSNSRNGITSRINSALNSSRSILTYTLRVSTTTMPVMATSVWTGLMIVNLFLEKYNSLILDPADAQLYVCRRVYCSHTRVICNSNHFSIVRICMHALYVSVLHR